VKAIPDRAGVMGHVECYSFRKLFCIRIYRSSGKDIEATRKAMGHTVISSTQSNLDGILTDAAIDDLIFLGQPRRCADAEGET
jgi:site-specific recombinase XerD